MRINNVNSDTSKQGLVSVVIITVVVTLCYLVAFGCFSTDHSLLGYFKWLGSVVSSLWPDDIIAAIVFIILPIFFYASLGAIIHSRQKALKDFGSVLNVKYVDFLYDRVNFMFNQPQYNIVCGYGEIKSLKMILHTVLVRTKSGSYPAVKEIELKFSLVNKELTLKNTPLNLMKTVYSIIDYSRNVENFSYKFEGVGAVEDVKEKIDDYLKMGLKQILATGAENAFKFMSIVFFALGIFIFYDFKNEYATDTWLVSAIPFFILVGISFIFDIFLLADKFKERKYKKTWQM